jgi:hypothetical protein
MPMIIEYISPHFKNNIQPYIKEFETVEDLLDIDFVKRWKEDVSYNEYFDHFYKVENVLMVKFKGAHNVFNVGQLKGDVIPDGPL